MKKSYKTSCRLFRNLTSNKKKPKKKSRLNSGKGNFQKHDSVSAKKEKILQLLPYALSKQSNLNTNTLATKKTTIFLREKLKTSLKSSNHCLFCGKNTNFQEIREKIANCNRVLVAPAFYSCCRSLRFRQFLKILHDIVVSNRFGFLLCQPL